MKKFYLFILLQSIVFINVDAQSTSLTCPYDTCGLNTTNYFINTGPAFTTHLQAMNAGMADTIKQESIFGVDTTVCYAFVQPPNGDWSRLQLFVSYPTSCPGGVITYTGYGTGVSTTSGSFPGSGNYSVSISQTTSGGETCIKGSLTVNVPSSSPNEITTMGTYHECNKIATTLNAGTLANCALTVGQTYKHCFKLVKSTTCPGDLVISPIITCNNNCVPATKKCLPIEYEATLTHTTCSGKNANGAINVNVCSNRKYAFSWGDTTLTTQNRAGLKPGTYTVTITDKESAACDTTATFTIFSQTCQEPVVLKPIEIPNVITPNDDPNNQYFEIENMGDYPNSRLEIYDRWGLKMYETDNYVNDWQGGDYKTGKPVPDGVYYYILYLSDKDKTVYKGFIQVLKAQEWPSIF